jgi:CRP/FNR family transcriptional regulator
LTPATTIITIPATNYQPDFNAVDMTVQTEFLKSIPYFSGLSPTELESLSRLIFERTAERGEVIVLEGEPADALFFIASGAVKVFKTSAEGKEQILSIVRPGESFNDVPIFDDAPNPASAQAMGPVVLYGLRKSELKATLQHHPQVALNIIRVLAERVRQLMSLVEDLSFRHVIGRVAKILLEYAGDGSGAGQRLTQQEMAAMAGTAREVVARSLKALEEEETIRLDRHRIVITDKEALQEMVTASV